MCACVCMILRWPARQCITIFEYKLTFPLRVCFSSENPTQPHRPPRTSERHRKPDINTLPKTDIDHYMDGLPGTSGGKWPRSAQGPKVDYKLDANVLFGKLEKLRQQQETDQLLRFDLAVMGTNQDETHSSQLQKQSLPNPELIEKLSALQCDSQDILDQHVSRVFSPHFSPAVPSSPGQPAPPAVRSQPPLPPPLRPQPPPPPINYSSKRKNFVKLDSPDYMNIITYSRLLSFYSNGHNETLQIDANRRAKNVTQEPQSVRIEYIR